MARVSIEDCMKYMKNRFELVVVAADRTRQLMSGSEPMIKSKNKEQVTALREIAAGYIEAVPEAELHQPKEEVKPAPPPTTARI